MTSRNFESTARELRDAIAKAKGGRRNTVVPSGLRARALVLAESQRAAGVSMRMTAAALGLHETTLMAWRRATSSPFVPARIVPNEREVDVPSSAGRLRVTIIDGLDAAMLATLLRCQ